ncbi:Uncharacterised protein [uncultured archaeon]|nr:Uncharacterised protein [uncultured archaeon]
MMLEILLLESGSAGNKPVDVNVYQMDPTGRAEPDSSIYRSDAYDSAMTVRDRDLKSFIDFIDEEVSTGWRDRIERNPKVLVGKPVIKGTRISVDLILDLLSHGCSEKDILIDYPQLTSDDIRACLSYAGATLRRVFLVGADCLPQ